MATDFDFDGSFNDDLDDEDEVVVAEEIEEEESGAGRNRLRTIILLLFIIVLACLACFVLPGYLGINIPVINPPTGPTATLEATTDPGGGGEGEPTATLEATTDPGGGGEGEPTATLEATTDPGGGGEGEPTATLEATTDPGGGGEGEPTATLEATTDPGGGGEGEPTATATSDSSAGNSCDNNADPTADIALDPNPAMMGKGQAIVTLDGSGSSDDSAIVEYGWDFGDGSDSVIGTDASTTHAYKAEDTYIVTLTVLDDCGATDSTTAEVTIVGPTPPADDDDSGADNEATATPTTTHDTSANVTLGSCYKVQRGDTLTGIASNFGVSLHDLARVNNVTTEYFVLADQGLFIPTSPIKPGPNGYEVQTGDTLNSIAFQCGVTLSHLAQVNGLNYDAALTAGQVIIVPIGYR